MIRIAGQALVFLVSHVSSTRCLNQTIGRILCILFGLA